MTTHQTRGIDRALVYARAIDGDLDRACASYTDSSHSRDYSIDRVTARHLAYARDCVYDLERAIASAQVRHRGDARARARTLARSVDLACRYPVYVYRCSIQAIKLVEILEYLADPAEATENQRGVRAVVWLAEVAVRVLPPKDQVRYADEWRADLWDLVQAGTPRRGQVAWALRLTYSAWPLRTVLRAPRRHRAEP